MNKEITKQLIDVLGALSSMTFEQRLKIVALESALRDAAPDIYRVYQRQYRSGMDVPCTSSQAQFSVALERLQALFRNELS